MATTINSYSVGFGMDAKGYIDGAKISRSETRALIKDIEAARTPSEKYAQAQDRIGKAYEAGAIDAKVANRLLDEQAKKYGMLEEIIEATIVDQKQFNKAVADSNVVVLQNSSALDTLSKVGNVVTGAYHAIRSAVNAVAVPLRMVNRLFDEFLETADNLDDVNDKAHKLGVTFNDLKGLTFAAERLGGAEAAAAMDRALGEMLKRGLVNPGEDAVDAFKRVADQITLAATQSDKAKIATEAFGKSGIQLLAVLQSGSTTIGEMVDKWARFGSLTEAQIEGVGQFNDAWDDVKLSLDGIAGRLVADLAPAMKLMITDFQVFLNATGTSASTIKTFTDDLIVGSTMVYEMAETFGRIQLAISQISTGRGLSAIATLGGIEDPVTKARDALTKVDEERRRLQDESNKKELGHVHAIQDAHIVLWEEWKKQDKLKQDAEKREVKHTHQMQDAHIQLFNKWNEGQDKLAETALDKAREYFEKERERDKKTRSDIVSGMHGSTIVAGSAEYFKRLADQQNSGIASMTIPDKPTPGEDAIVKKAAELLAVAIEEQKQTAEQVKLARETLVAIKENGFKRIR